MFKNYGKVRFACSMPLATSEIWTVSNKLIIISTFNAASKVDSRIDKSNMGGAWLNVDLDLILS